MLILQGISYIHPGKELLFTGIDLAISKHDKVALVGNNGTGKSTLLKIMAGCLSPSAGLVKTGAVPYYVPQIFGQFNHLTIAQALQVDCKLRALNEILAGHVTAANLAALNDDWGIEARCTEAFAHWQLNLPDLDQEMATLSGGQKTKVFLAGIMIHRPGIVLLDEPSNHLDTAGRSMLYDFIKSSACTTIVVSHDRALLNLLHTVYELSRQGIKAYGGNYAFFAAQKTSAQEALLHDIKNREKALRKARETEKETLERKQKLDARGKKKQEKAGLPTISMNTFKNNAEKSSARLKDMHAEKISTIAQELQQLRTALPGTDKMKMNFDNADLHAGKTLARAESINISYGGRWLWKQNLNFHIASGDRLAIKGANGSGKTTLVKMLLGKLQPGTGNMHPVNTTTLYIDQDYALIDNALTVYAQAQQFNSGALQEHEIKIRLSRFLFPRDVWDKPCHALSGGEKMRLMLCALSIGSRAPGMVILDEPTNNLDLQSTAILTEAVQAYRGTLIVISHDAYFLEEVNITRTLFVE